MAQRANIEQEPDTGHDDHGKYDPRHVREQTGHGQQEENDDECGPDPGDLGPGATGDGGTRAAEAAAHTHAPAEPGADVGHAAADNQRVDLGRQVLEDIDLGRDLGAADEGDEGVLGVVDQRIETLAIGYYRPAKM